MLQHLMPSPHAISHCWCVLYTNLLLVYVYVCMCTFLSWEITLDTCMCHNMFMKIYYSLSYLFCTVQCRVLGRGHGINVYVSVGYWYENLFLNKNVIFHRHLSNISLRWKFCSCNKVVIETKPNLGKCSLKKKKIFNTNTKILHIFFQLPVIHFTFINRCTHLLFC